VRRFLFLVHRWVGVAIGLYISLVCLTGAALVFRIDMQRARHPHLFTPGTQGPLVDPVDVLERVRHAYPGHRLSGVEAPTSRRPTYLAYATRDRDVLTVLIDPATAAILGELPEDGLVQSIQQLHFNLMGGGTGRTLNGIGAGFILVMCVTGVVLWWPGRRHWPRGFVGDVGRDTRRVIWELHRATGAWTVGFLALFAITGLSLAFPSGFRSAVNAVSPITVRQAPVSSAADVNGSRPAWREMIARARQARPAEHVARVVLPFNERAPFLVMFSTRSPTPAGSGLSPVYLDQFSGELLGAGAWSAPTAGDLIMSWTTPLHVGGFGGAAIRWVWFVFGVAPSLLFVTGVTMWWTRVDRPRSAS
jgi:uncharacterized iron-regulated membrane protein